MQLHRMPAPLKIDWEQAKGLFLKGVPLLEIARELGVNPATLRAHSSRHNWRGIAKRAELTMQRKSWSERAEDWPNRIADLTERHLAALELKDPAKLSLRDLQL